MRSAGQDRPCRRGARARPARAPSRRRRRRADRSPSASTAEGPSRPDRGERRCGAAGDRQTRRPRSASRLRCTSSRVGVPRQPARLDIPAKCPPARPRAGQRRPGRAAPPFEAMDVGDRALDIVECSSWSTSTERVKSMTRRIGLRPRTGRPRVACALRSLTCPSCRQQSVRPRMLAVRPVVMGRGHLLQPRGDDPSKEVERQRVGEGSRKVPRPFA